MKTIFNYEGRDELNIQLDGYVFNDCDEVNKNKFDLESILKGTGWKRSKLEDIEE